MIRDRASLELERESMDIYSIYKVPFEQVSRPKRASFAASQT